MAAWIHGQVATFDAAVAEAASILSSTRAPLIAGLAADVDGIRAAFSLGARIGASFDPVGAPNLYADLTVLASAGAMATTPSEMLQRADLVVTVGERAKQEALVATAGATEPVVGRGAGQRRVLVIDEESIGYALGPALGLLRAVAMGRLGSDDTLTAAATALRHAQFGVAVYDPDELGELAVDMLQGLVVELNETTRFFTLSLTDPWQSRSALQVSAWTSGGGPRVGLGRSYPEHDPWRFDSARQAASGEIDTALWLAAIEAPAPAWLSRLKTVTLSGTAEPFAGDVVFAVGIPGRTSGGVIWDQRRGTLAYASAPHPTDDPRAGDVIRAIEQAIVGKRAASC
jgi:formylmethanofuran dehydrogenase subunit B